MRPKRSLGQNFLKNIGIAEKMASLADIGTQDTVVEVGPGRGMLTRVLLKYASEVIAIEKDDKLFEQLGVFQGFSTEVDRYLPKILDKQNNKLPKSNHPKNSLKKRKNPKNQLPLEKNG